MSSDLDHRFMTLALTLGRRGLGNAWPNPAVGAVVVKDGVVVGRGWTQPGGRPHAEVEALRRAGEAARGATLYATLEPCSHHGKTPPCVDAIMAAGIARVVSALEDPNPRDRRARATRGCASRALPSMSASAPRRRVRAHAGHIRRVRDGRPHVTLKLAVSADGKAGLAGPQAGRDHRRGGARARAADARDERCGGDRHRHGAGRRSAAHLPAARAWSSARRCASCSTARCGCRRSRGLRRLGDAHARLGVRRRDGEARSMRTS